MVGGGGWWAGGGKVFTPARPHTPAPYQPTRVQPPPRACTNENFRGEENFRGQKLQKFKNRDFYRENKMVYAQNPRGANLYMSRKIFRPNCGFGRETNTNRAGQAQGPHPLNENRGGRGNLDEKHN